MRPILGLLALLASSTAAVPASAIFVSFENAANGLYATGIDASGLPAAGGSVDSHYALMQLPAGCAGSLECQEDAAGGNSFGPSTYVVQGPNGVHPLIAGVWTLANDADSQWIGPRADQTNPVVGGSSFPFVGIFASDAQPYVYRTVFDVSALGLFPETSRIDLAWASDSASAAAGLGLVACATLAALRRLGFARAPRRALR